jgi:hypothetical protein
MPPLKKEFFLYYIYPCLSQNMKTIALVLFLLISMTTAAQKITVEQAEQFASLLVEKEILNDKGKETLLEEIKKGNIEVEFHSTVKGVTHTRSALTKETILQFCGMAFSGEQLYRIIATGTGWLILQTYLMNPPKFIKVFSRQLKH